MPSPQPLTPTPPAQLDWSRPETPVASDFGDIYFSTDGGVEETRTVFLKGCGLPERWKDQSLFTIGELGFGSGLNFLATWQLWLDTAAPDQRLHFVSVEKFPFDTAQLRQALSAWPELSQLSEKLIAAWPGRVKGVHRLNFGSISLTLIHDDVATAFEAASGLFANAWFLDGFSPAKNEAMWSPEVLKRVGQLCAADARLASFTVAGSVRKALTEAGFEVSREAGFGRKRHRLEAKFGQTDKPAQPKPEKVLIIGAGIAGRSLARSLSQRHLKFDLIDNRHHPAASGNPAALVKPRLDLQDRPESRFFLSAYLHALREYETEAILARGVRQMPKSEQEGLRFEKLAKQNPLGAGHLRWTGSALEMDSALVIDPRKVFADCEIREEDAETALKRDEYSHVLFAAGYGVRDLLPSLEMRFSRGQLTWAQGQLERPVAYGGYALSYEGEILVGATHDRLGEDDPFALRPEDDAHNLRAYEDMTGAILNPSTRPSRASVRVTSRDTLPVIARLDDSRWALTGLGSRGFTFAPLLAEALVAEMCGEVSPLERAVIDRFAQR